MQAVTKPQYAKYVSALSFEASAWAFIEVTRRRDELVHPFIVAQATLTARLQNGGRNMC